MKVCRKKNKKHKSKGLYTSIVYLLCMKQRTNIQIEHKTLERLKKLRITKRETYDEILNRLIDKENAN